MATAPYSFPYPSAATYPLPPPFPGGYPSSYASSSYLAPPAPGFPVPGYGPSTFVPPPPWPPPAYPYLPPVSAYATAPAFPSPISTQLEPNQPAPAATQIHGDLHHSSFGSPILSQPPPTRNPPIPNPSTPSVATSPDPSSSKAVFTSADNYLNHRFMEDDAAVQAVADKRVPAKNAIRHRRQRKLLNLHARLDEQQAGERTAINTLQGQLANLKSMAAQLAVSIDKHVSSVQASKPEQSQHPMVQNPSSQAFESNLKSMLSRFAVSHDKQSTSAHASKPEKSQHITVVPAAPAHVASQVFAEMPTPSSSQGTHGSAPDYRSGHHTPIRSTCLLDGNSSLSEQNLDERSHRYEFPNLSRKTVVRADGTEQSYYALPENYPLQRALPEPVCAVGNDKTEVDSNESGDVFTTTPEQQQPFEDVQPIDENASVKVQQYLRAPQLNVLLIHERRKEWHPGASAPLHSSNAGPPRELGYVAMLVPEILTVCIQAGSYVQQLRDSSCSVLITHEKRKEWDPGDTKIHVLFTVAAGATKLQCPDVYKLAIVQKLAVKIGAKRVPIFQSHIMRSDAFSLGWTKVHAAAVHVLAVQHSEVTLLAKHYLSLLSQDTQEQDQLLKENEQTSTYCSKASDHALICQHSLMSTTVTPQVQSQEIERKPVYDAYNEEDNACLNSVDAVLIYNSEKQKVTSASFVWDPGTMLLWYKCKWCLLYTEERINWLTELRCYGVVLWLIHFQPP